MRFFRARSLILSPSKKSIARPALKSLSGSERLAPWEKVSFTLSLWALPTAIIPSRNHTGLPIHFHSSMISRSASRMFLRMLASVLPRQSVSPAISWSIRSDGFIGSSHLASKHSVRPALNATPLLRTYRLTDSLPVYLRLQPLAGGIIARYRERNRVLHPIRARLSADLSPLPFIA